MNTRTDERQGALADLLQRAAGGDVEAFAAFYDATCVAAYRLALGLTGAAEPAEHLCRIGYLRAWRHAASYDATACSPLVWLLLMTRSVNEELAAAA